MGPHAFPFFPPLPVLFIAATLVTVGFAAGQFLYSRREWLLSLICASQFFLPFLFARLLIESKYSGADLPELIFILMVAMPLASGTLLSIAYPRVTLLALLCGVAATAIGYWMMLCIAVSEF